MGTYYEALAMVSPKVSIAYRTVPTSYGRAARDSPSPLHCLAGYFDVLPEG